MFSITHRITPKDADNAYKHVHHADTLFILEKARLEFLKSINFPLESFFEQNLFVVIRNINITYKRELFPSEITVTCENLEIDEKRVVINQRIINDQGKNAVIASVENIFISGDLRRSVLPPDDFIQAFLSVNS